MTITNVKIFRVARASLIVRTCDLLKLKQISPLHVIIIPIKQRSNMINKDKYNRSNTVSKRNGTHRELA
jgi:hypothetical protein